MESASAPASDLGFRRDVQKRSSAAEVEWSLRKGGEREERGRFFLQLPQ